MPEDFANKPQRERRDGRCEYSRRLLVTFFTFFCHMNKKKLLNERQIKNEKKKKGFDMSYASVGGSRHTKENHRIYYKLRGDSDAPIKIVRRERVLKQDA